MQYRLAVGCPCPELSPLPGSQATFAWGLEGRCLEDGPWRARELAVGRRPVRQGGGWGEGGRPCLSPQGRFQRGRLLTGVAP